MSKLLVITQVVTPAHRAREADRLLAEASRVAKQAAEDAEWDRYQARQRRRYASQAGVTITIYDGDGNVVPDPSTPVPERK